MSDSMIGRAGKTGCFFEDARAYALDDFYVREKDVSKAVQVVEISLSSRTPVPPRVEGFGDFKGLNLNFILEGRCTFKSDTIHIESGKDSTSLIYMNEPRGVTHFRTRAFRCICMMLGEDFIDPSLREQLPPLDTGPNLLLRCGRTDPLSRLCLGDLMVSRYEGVLNDIFVQGKILEILAGEFARALPSGTAGPSGMALTRQDVNAIKKAREILVGAIEDPPSIPALSRMVGLNQFKLKKGFRQVFNTTPYAVVREHRMKVARQLLRSSEFNAGEISAMVGIKNPAHFTRMFTRHYGMRPSDVMKTRTYVDFSG